MNKIMLSIVSFKCILQLMTQSNTEINIKVQHIISFRICNVEFRLDVVEKKGLCHKYSYC